MVRNGAERQILVVALLVGIVIFFGGIKYYQVRLHAVEFSAERMQEEDAATLEKANEQAKGTGRENGPGLDNEEGLAQDLINESSSQDLPRLFTVHVVGAVENPGVYSLEEGKRINDAVQLAGVSPQADLTLINLAAPLEDGRQIYVPKKGETAPPAALPYRSETAVTGPININTASSAVLDQLPGIGPALAGRIIDYRKKNGPFQTVEEITKVSGIGPALLAKIKDRITVR